MLELKKIYKKFDQKTVVKNVSFSVKRGEVLGFIGRNGAGKSTTMRIITGFFAATSGEILFDGENINQHSLKSREKIGYLPESAPVYFQMSVSGFLKFCAEMRGFYGEMRDQEVAKVIKLCFLEKVKNQIIETLSKGYRHRTSLAQALLGNPELLILDEPTDGLDPNQKREVRKLIKEWGKEKAVIISTHILEEVEAVCDKIVLIDKGEILFSGTVQDFKNLHHEPNSVKLDEIFYNLTIKDEEVKNA